MNKKPDISIPETKVLVGMQFFIEENYMIFNNTSSPDYFPYRSRVFDKTINTVTEYLEAIINRYNSGDKDLEPCVKPILDYFAEQALLNEDFTCQ